MTYSDSERTIRVLIVEDHPRVRAQIRGLVEAAGDMLVVGEAGDGVEALEVATQQQPDVILLDLELPLLRGEAVMAKVLLEQPNTGVLIVTAHDDGEYCRGMLESGAAGYLVKDDVPGSLLNAVRNIYLHVDETWISPSLIGWGPFPKSRRRPPAGAQGTQAIQ